MDDTPYVNDGADASLRKTVSLLNKIEAKTGATTITGPVTVSNEVEVTNSSGSPIPISGTIGTFQNNLVNQGTQFSWGTSTGPGSFGVFDAGTDADYVEFALGGGGGGFTFNLSLSLSNSPFVSGASTANPEVVVFADRYPVANLEDVYRFSNQALQSGTNGYYVLGLVHFGIKYRYVRLDVTGAGGGGYGGSFVSYKSFGPFHPTGGYQKNKILNRVPIAGVVDINSCTRELPVTGTFWQATQPVSLTSAPVTPITDNGGSLTVDGSVSVSNFPATQPISGTVTANNQSLTTGSGTLPGTSAVDTDIISSIDVSGFSEIMVQFTGFPFLALAQFQVSNDNSTFVPQAALPLTTALPSPLANINSAGFYKLALAGARYVRLRVAGAGLSGTWVYSYTLNPRSSSNFGQLVSATTLPLPTGASSEMTLTAVNTKIPSNLTVSSTRLLVDGSGVTQPTRETQPTGDYVINTSSVAAFSASGSALQSASFDAGANADYVVLTLSGGGSSGAFYYDLSPNNLGWSAGNTSAGFATYYDLPATSTTDAYSYKNVTATSLFGSTRASFAGRFIIPLTQSEPGVGTITTYRYIRLNLPASNGGWRYRFASYKSVDAVTAASQPGNPSTTRVAGRVDVGYVSNLPTLTATVTQATAANLNATVVGSGSFTAAQATASSLKAQAQILDSAGALLTYGSTGVAGSPSSDVITVQGASAGTAVNTKVLNSSGTAVTYAETGTYGSPSVDVLSVQNPQGVTATITTFTSTTASTSLVAAGSTRKALTVYNSGAGDLYISPTAVCTTTNFQLKLSSGDFWECPSSQVLLSHTAVFSTAGTAYVTSLT